MTGSNQKTWASAAVRSGELRGGNAAENAAIIRAVLGGELGPRRDIVLLNAAYGLLAAVKPHALQGLSMTAEPLTAAMPRQN